MIYDLPDRLDVCGTMYEIRAEYRAALDICAALSDPELNGQEKAIAALTILYPQFRDMPMEHYQEAIQKCCWFLNRGEDGGNACPRPKAIDWEQDFQMIVSDINKVAGCEVRSMPFCHWWTFLSWFDGIGEGQLSTVVSIREKLRKGKKLADWEREFYRENRAKVDFKVQHTQAEEDVLKAWGVK